MFKHPTLMIVHQLRNFISRSIWRKTFVVFFLAVNIASCENSDNQNTSNYLITNGCYEGFFEYQNDYYRSSICFENGKYIERPSLVFTQKNEYCLTAGTYSTESYTLTFKSELSVFNAELRQECLVDM